ncbi:efflux transporter periplasmic adaptor subunit [Salinibacter sp. 10B]|uniref:efflux RND transporter periplasmic adaptor subunit n=1 Tax=Salinibacter sp. 10B TaxID=1923971 RepID=UPI000CF48317|nr:efflux RND transporter periplasmic adaptor subunit [Salinibacter sp. 10B]PQJ36305.1 efflux transporter periplasmic adaptor subunit [Salinibacter sp. 10B]
MTVPRLLFSTPSSSDVTFRTLATFVLTPLLAGLLLFTSGCSDGQASKSSSTQARSQPKTRVETLLLEPTSFTDVIEVTGTVEAIDDATLSAQTDGPVTMLLELGTRVDKGTPVAKIDAEEAESAVEQAKAQYELAQDRFERQQPLYRDSVISALEFEQVRSERNQARAALNQAQTRLADAILEAPFAGTIEDRFLEVGEQAAPGTRLARLVNTRRVKITAGIPERYANDIEIGTPVQLDFRRYGAGVRTADVTFVGNTIDPQSRTFTVEITVSNENRTLKPEMGVNLRVTRAVLDSALVLPRTAVLRDETGTHVYVVDRSDTTAVARNREITLGPETGGSVVADSGLAAGEEVIIVGQNNVSPGAPLEVTDQFNRTSAAGTPYEENSLPTPPTE